MGVGGVIHRPLRHGDAEDLRPVQIDDGAVVREHVDFQLVKPHGVGDIELRAEVVGGVSLSGIAAKADRRDLVAFTVAELGDAV